MKNKKQKMVLMNTENPQSDGKVMKITLANLGDTFRHMRALNAWKTCYPAKPFGGTRKQRKANAVSCHRSSTPYWAAKIEWVNP